MRQAVHAQKGIIHRELGDGLFAIFGAPIANDNHAVMACLAAFDLQVRIAALKDEELKVRIGLHTGELVVGPRALDLGSTYEFDGPALILAERLQAAPSPAKCWSRLAATRLRRAMSASADANALRLRAFPSRAGAIALGIGELSKWQVISRRSRTDSSAARRSLLSCVLNRHGRSGERGIRIGISGEAASASRAWR